MTSGSFITEQGRVAGSYDAVTGIISDDKQEIVGNIQDFQTSGFWVADSLLNYMPTLVVTSSRSKERSRARTVFEP